MTISLATYRTPTTNRLDNIFDTLFDPFFESVTIPKKRNPSPDTKVLDEDTQYIISIAAPGLDKKDFDISVTGEVLTVSTQNTETDFGPTSFTKTWALPDGTKTTDITAGYQQGILRVNVVKPKAFVAETTTIEVS
jgi:HSP20 family protein